MYILKQSGACYMFSTCNVVGVLLLFLLFVVDVVVVASIIIDPIPFSCLQSESFLWNSLLKTGYRDHVFHPDLYHPSIFRALVAPSIARAVSCISFILQSCEMLAHWVFQAPWSHSSLLLDHTHPCSLITFIPARWLKDRMLFLYRGRDPCLWSCLTKWLCVHRRRG